MLIPSDRIGKRHWEEIELEHNLIQQSLIQQSEKPREHHLFKRVDQWEEESVGQVRHIAEAIRKELVNRINQHTIEIKEKLQIIGNELQESRKENDFTEIDLQKWTEKLEELKTELNLSTIVNIVEESTSLISKIRIDRQQDPFDVFEHVYENTQIQENGSVVVKDNLDGHTEVSGSKCYASGRHILRFKIEHLSSHPWMFFGIISQLEPLKKMSTSSEPTYGWSTQN